MALEHALALFDAGWHPLPLPAQAKEPPPKGLTGFDGTDLPRAGLDALVWSGNLATRMPPDVLGLDVDAYKGGLDTLKGLIDELGPLPPTWISHSGRDDGSGIRYYRVPVGLAWIGDLPGIELIHRGWRYAVMPPSVHPDGRPYAWWDQAEGAPGEGPPLVEELPELPWPWIGYLSRAQAEDLTTRSRAATLEAVHEFVDKYTAAEAPGYIGGVIVAHFLERWHEGYSRHATMQHCLIWALECVRAGVAPARSTLSQLAAPWSEALAAEPRRAELHSDRRTTEFDAMVRHAVGKANAKTDAEIARLHDDIVGPRFNVPIEHQYAPGQAATEEAPTTIVSVLTFESLPDPFEAPVIEWHAEALLSRPTHGELAGAEKSLKSYTGLLLDVGLAAGLPVLGRFRVVEPQRVLLLAGEGGRGPWLRRFGAVCAAYGVAPGDLTEQVRFTTATASVASVRFSEGVRAELEMFGPALVHLDPWYAYASGQADSRQVTEVGAHLAAVAELCSSYGASLLINHHYNRGAGDGLRQITGAGHAEWVDSWLLLRHRERADPSIGRYRLRLDVGSRQWGGESYDLDIAVDPLTGRVGWDITEASDEPDDGIDPLTEAKLELLRTGRKARKAMTRAAWIERATGRDQTLRAAFDELVIDEQIVVVATFRSGSNTVSTYEVPDA